MRTASDCLHRPFHSVLVVLIELLICGCLACYVGCPGQIWAAESSDAAATAESGSAPAETAKEESLFDGKSLDGWKVTQFGGQGEVSVKDGCLTLGFGSSLTGVTYEKDFPKVDYEILLEARRLDGSDFFCGLTFPVEESHCSLILGGWGGGVVGLSSIDGRDASENETTQYMSFKNRTWYLIRVRVTKREITAWIQDKRVIQQPLEGRKVSTRSEVNLSRPLGIAAWETSAALRNIRFRRLPAADAAQP